MNPAELSRRERQIMDVLFRLGEASAADVRDGLDDPPSYSAVRAHLRILTDKGHVDHTQDGPRYVYRPTVHPEKAQRSALRHVLATFFDDSPAEAFAALLEVRQLEDSEFDRLAELIDQARQEGR
jgi:BlaI family transcriptional regulator, penicillinase repressor